MTVELTLLAASVFLGIVHIIAVSHLQSRQRGYRWTASSREQHVPPLTGVAGRADRALRNYLETFPLFAAVILLTAVADIHSWLTLWGAQLYFLGPRRLRDLVCSRLAAGALARVEHPDHRHAHECCGGIPGVRGRASGSRSPHAERPCCSPQLRQ
ncbi:MAPEG family protein [Bradyrhizobium sp. 33ap4]|uniref:MAPEG family protein n=1 Tax=Bradyrhizobium sp. 33ap4 TaxID=3061630 RepID=UPI0039774C52